MKTIPNILVIGDICTDVYVYGKVNRLCPDVPAPVFKTINTVKSKGMAGNVARQFEALGCNVLRLTNVAPIEKRKYIDYKTNHTFIRIDQEENIDSLNIDVFNKHIQLRDWDAVVISDYGKGFVSYNDIEHICKQHNNVFIDTKKEITNHFTNAKCIKINKPEWERIKHTITLDNWEEKLIVTLGRDGCKYNGQYYAVKKVDVYDLSGAGDTFLAGLVYKYCLSKDLIQAIRFANECASKVVQKKGVAVI